MLNRKEQDSPRVKGGVTYMFSASSDSRPRCLHSWRGHRMTVDWSEGQNGEVNCGSATSLGGAALFLL